MHLKDIPKNYIEQPPEKEWHKDYAFEVGQIVLYSHITWKNKNDGVQRLILDRWRLHQSSRKMKHFMVNIYRISGITGGVAEESLQKFHLEQENKTEEIEGLCKSKEGYYLDI